MLRHTHIATCVRSMLTKEFLYVIMSYSESKLASKILYLLLSGLGSVSGGLPDSQDGMVVFDELRMRRRHRRLGRSHRPSHANNMVRAKHGASSATGGVLPRCSSRCRMFDRNGRTQRCNDEYIAD